MKRLLIVEIKRMFARRLLRVFALVAVLGAALVGVLVFINADAADPFRITELSWIIPVTNAQLSIFTFVLGASFVGAEWRSQSITTTLTWEPRRVRVFFAKTLACLLVVSATMLALSLLVGLALLPMMLFKGSTAGLDGAWALELTGRILRSVGLAAIAAGLGFSIGSIGRNTAAALGTGFIYLAGIEGLLRSWRPGSADWLLGDNAGIFLTGDAEGPLYSGRSILEAGLIMLFYLSVVMGAAVVLFRKRDVT
ncbi:MAG TPA: hypothetical protein VEV82_11335 [Actinomycetota bacterium]|nr:hypothetical protein [Actinomycetota bacterium]